VKAFLRRWEGRPWRGQSPGGHRDSWRSKPPPIVNGLARGSKAVKAAAGSRESSSDDERDGRQGDNRLAG
jgi:hypothetical protein